MTDQYNPKKIGEILVDSGLLTKKQVEQAVVESKKRGERLGATLVYMGFVSEVDIAETLSLQLHIPYLNLETVVPDQEAINLVSESLAKSHNILPISIGDGHITVAMSDPLNFSAIQDIGFATGLKVKPAVATISDIVKTTAQFYEPTVHVTKILEKMEGGHVEVLDDNKESTLNMEEVIKKGGSPPVIRIVNSIIYDAVKHRASDIHIEPREDSVQVRQRIDGLLQDVLQLPKWINGAVVSRVKIMASLDISERRIPQDGRVKIKIEDREIDLRISVLPIQYGEKIVIRILDTSITILTMAELGLSPGDSDRVKEAIERPQGVVLLTGPTGSGKSSSVYAMINHIKSPVINIVSLEDPIEYELEGTNQVAINEKTGLTFAYGLRSVLRQDPDVVIVGEMRDTETANIAVQASLTGHLVVSTLHTNTAVAAITRLRNMGVQPYLLASSLNGVIAQRLVRKLCEHCKAPYKPTDEDFHKVGLKPDINSSVEFYRGVGCEECSKTGYKGRTGVFEIMLTTTHMRELIANDSTEEMLVKAALEGGMRHMSEDGIDKVKKGVTSLDELMRVIYMGDDDEIFVCSRCSEAIRPDYVTCPHCGEPITLKCPDCDRGIEPHWKFCAYCSCKFDNHGEETKK